MKMLLSPQSFLFIQRQKSSFELHLFCRLQMLSIWTGLKFYRFTDLHVAKMMIPVHDLIHSPIHYFETVPNSKKLQTTSET